MFNFGICLNLIRRNRVLRPVADVHIDEGEEAVSDEDFDDEDFSDTNSSESGGSELDGKVLVYVRS